MTRSLRHRFVLPAFLAAAALLGLSTTPVAASVLEIDLSKPAVELTASFDGADLLLFGIHKPDTEVIIVVRGPEINTSVRLKERVAGVWVNGDEVMFENAPSYYTVAATRNPTEILPRATLKENRIGVDNLMLETSGKNVERDRKNFTAGLIRNMQASDLYGDGFNKIEKRGEQLFRTHLWFPSNVHVGQYIVDTYLVQGRYISAQSSTTITVHKVGIEADIYNFAHDYALLYGLLAVVIALVAGWAANAAFRRG